MCRKLIYLISIVLALSLVGVTYGTEGLLGEYYHGTAGDPWRELVMERVDPTIDFSWGEGSPDPSVNANGFTVRWTGMVTVPASATYTFYTVTDDGIQLWVNNEQLIDNWTDHGNTEDSGDIALASGRQYEIILEYYENGGGAVCELSWESPSITRQAIPSQYLSVERPFPRKPDPADGAIIKDTWVPLSWEPGDYAASHNIYFGEDQDEVQAGTGDTFRINQTNTDYAVGFIGFPYPEGVEKGTTYYWRIEDIEADGITTHSGPVWSFTIAPKIAYGPSPADGAESVDPNIILKWEPGNGAILHYVFFSDDYNTVNDAVVGAPQGIATYNPAGTLDSEKTYYWRVDERHASETLKGKVWSFSTPGAVVSLNPYNGATDVKMTTTLSWTPADTAASHEVYFGTDKDVVRSADKNSLEYKGPKALGAESYDPGKLAWYATYYWRVDEVDSLGGLSKGPLWSFTTADFISIDDFEDYDVGNKEIWWAWKDGLGYVAHGSEPAYSGNGTGSAVGDETTLSYMEEKIVHGGGKSMPVLYDNNQQDYAYYSEVELTLSTTRDWTEEGVGTLTIWFRGKSDNDAEPLYVALSNPAGVPVAIYNDDSLATQIGAWTEWIIPLQSFADMGIELTEIDRIAIGVGTQGNITIPGGSGKMFFDDIRLYRSEVDAAE